MQLALHDGMYTAYRGSTINLRYREKLMNLSLQFGFGMMEHCKALVQEWKGGLVILSPRDLDNDQLTRLSKSITSVEAGQVALDPQFYLPHADHYRLIEHEYWPRDYVSGVFFGGPQQTGLLRRLKALNDALGTSIFILPSELAQAVNDDWNAIQSGLLAEALRFEPTKPVALTIALDESSAKDSRAIGRILEFAERSPSPWYYIVAEHPRGDYLVKEPIWLANVLDLVAGLKLRGRRVILGYSNHQMLCAGAARADFIASGTWMNVRSFPPEKFREKVEGEVRQRSTWFYCPHTLSEYKIPFLDVAYRTGVLQEMRPKFLTYPQIEALFAGGEPSTVGLTEQMSFRHYLTSMKLQVGEISRQSFDQTADGLFELLDHAEASLAVLRSKRVSGQLRDFSDYVDVNRAALEILVQDRGALLRRKWHEL